MTREQLLRKAEQYHADAERYDRTVCSGPIGPCGGILPLGPLEQGLINRNALKLRAALLNEAVEFGWTKQDVVSAIAQTAPQARRRDYPAKP